LPRARARKSILLVPVLALATLVGAAQAQPQVPEHDIVGPPSTALRRSLAEAALDYLRSLPSVAGSEISDEVVFRSAEKLHLVCVRRLVPGQTSGGPAYAVTAVTIRNGMPQQAFSRHAACDDRTLKYHPFPEMR
jgi:hypothetical protein